MGERRRRIGLDLDGVTYDFQSTYVYLLEHYRDVDFPPGLDWWTTWDSADAFTTEADRAWVWTTGIDLGLFRYGHLKKGAIDGVAALAKLGDVEVVSHRPRAAVRDTLAFLTYTQLPLAGVHLLTSEEPKSGIGCDVYIDDGPHVIEELQKAGKEVVVYSAPYNQESMGLRAYGWDDIPKLVEEALG